MPGQQLATQLKTADIRQTHIENGQRRSLMPGLIQRRQAVGIANFSNVVRGLATVRSRATITSARITGRCWFRP
jgi:hypothetical protein